MRRHTHHAQQDNGRENCCHKTCRQLHGQTNNKVDNKLQKEVVFTEGLSVEDVIEHHEDPDRVLVDPLCRSEPSTSASTADNSIFTLVNGSFPRLIHCCEPFSLRQFTTYNSIEQTKYETAAMST